MLLRDGCLLADHGQGGEAASPRSIRPLAPELDRVSCLRGEWRIKVINVENAFLLVVSVCGQRNDMFLNLIGVVILFRYGMPFHVPTGGAVSLVTETRDQADIALEQRYTLYGYFGLVCLIVGTGFQMIAAWRAD
jgi:hypothetical protein